VPGNERRHELVADLVVGHRRAVGTARLQQHRQHVVALGAVAPALVYEREELGIDVRPVALEAPEVAATAEPTLRDRQHGDRALAELEHRREPIA
jgi:hypothetical protein